MMTSPSEKVALLLSIVGHEQAGALFSALAPSEQTRVLRALLSEKNWNEDDVEAVCSEFLATVQKIEAGQRSLTVPRSKTFAGIELPRLSRVAEICREIPDWVLLNHLRTQLDSVVAAVIGSLPAVRAASIFREFAPERQVCLLLLLAKEKILDDVALDALEEDLESLKTSRALSRSGQQVGGRARVLTLVQALESNLRNEILVQLAEREPNLATFLEGGLLSVERLSDLLPAHLALVLSQLKDSEIGACLRGEKSHVQGLYLGCLSRSRRCEVEALLIPERKITQKQKADACERLRQCVQQLKEQGKIIFPWEEELVG
jgi:flagellar motor switch protein FliG